MFLVMINNMHEHPCQWKIFEDNYLILRILDISNGPVGIKFPLLVGFYCKSECQFVPIEENCFAIVLFLVA